MLIKSIKFLKELADKVGISMLSTTIKEWILKLFKGKNKKALKAKKQTSAFETVVTETITETTDTTIDLKIFKSCKKKSKTKTIKNNSKEEAC